MEFCVTRDLERRLRPKFTFDSTYVAFCNIDDTACVVCYFENPQMVSTYWAEHINVNQAKGKM